MFAAVPPAFVQLASVLNGRQCLDDPDKSTRNGTNIQMWDCNGTAAQQVTVTSSSEQQMLGKCLSVANGDTSNRAPVVLAPCGATNSQVWQFR